jgi:hypothetical protein
MTTIYDIRIREALDEQWALWFDPLTLTHTPGGQTVLCGALPDQAALHGVLASIAHLGLTLVSVSSVPADVPTRQPSDRPGLAIESGEER